MNLLRLALLCVNIIRPFQSYQVCTVVNLITHTKLRSGFFSGLHVGHAQVLIIHGFKVFTVAATLLSLLGPLLAKRIIVCERCGLEHRLRSPALGINLDTESM